MAQVNGQKVWVAGSKGDEPRSGLGMPNPHVNALGCEAFAIQNEPRRALDLFSGSGSVRRTLERHGFKVISLDCDPTTNATIITDILEWDFASAYPPGYFQIITASPPCTELALHGPRGKGTCKMLWPLCTAHCESLNTFAQPSGGWKTPDMVGCPIRFAWKTFLSPTMTTVNTRNGVTKSPRVSGVASTFAA